MHGKRSPFRLIVPSHPAVTLGASLVLLVGGSLLPGCGSDSGSTDGAQTGGSPTTGGVVSSGGESTAGGNPATGGMVTSGGTTGGGGSPASGGSPNSGGSPASGGSEAGGSGGSGGDGGTGGAAAGGSASSGGSAGSGGSGGGGGEAPSNCQDTSLTSGDSNRTVDVGGVMRKFILHIPQGYTGTDPTPMVIDFHPLGGTGAQEQSGSGFAALSDQEGFMVLWPDGIDNAWDVGPCCTNTDVDDLGFARAMIADLTQIACVDQRRIYATGFSNGGGMSNTVACHAADVFAAIAPSAFDLLVDDEETCQPSRPISVLSMRGTNDTAVPYEGGRGGGGRVTFLGAQQTFELWAELAGCSGDPSVMGDTQIFTACSAGVEVGLLTIQGGGHAWGPASVAWDFLKDKRLP